MTNTETVSTERLTFLKLWAEQSDDEITLKASEVRELLASRTQSPAEWPICLIELESYADEKTASAFSQMMEARRDNDTISADAMEKERDAYSDMTKRLRALRAASIPAPERSISRRQFHQWEAVSGGFAEPHERCIHCRVAKHQSNAIELCPVPAAPSAPERSKEEAVVKVKPLEWKKVTDQIPKHAFAAYTPFGRWLIVCEFLSMNHMVYRFHDTDYETLAAAIAAAQADYEQREQRIRSALETPPLHKEGEAQCCVCGKKGLSTVEGDGGTECQLEDGRWTCSQDCYYTAIDWFSRSAAPVPVPVTITDWNSMFFWPDEKRRLWWISQTIAQRGRINRADICTAFGISVPQASKDIQKWIALHPGALEYDKKAKCYVPALTAPLSKPGEQG